MSSPYRYQSSTDFFRDCFRKKGRSRFFTKKMGYSSPRLIEMICQGKRFASTDFLFRSRDFLKLSDEEFLYLTLLVKRDRNRLKQISDPQLEEQIKTVSSVANSKQLLDENFFRVISDWPHLVLKQYFRQARKASIKSLKNRLRQKLSEKEISTAIENLKTLGILTERPDGTIEPFHWKGIVSPTEIPSRAIRSHHRQMMERAMEAQEEVSISEREITSLTFCLNPKNLTKLKKEIQEFKNRIDRLYDEPTDTVYQLNIQLFPHIQ